MLPTQTNLNPIHTLSQQSAALYHQLKQRQMEYINLIKDLHFENHRLKALISSQPFLNYNNQNLFNGHSKTPSFNSPQNSINNSQRFDKIPFPQQIKNAERFSFADKNEEQLSIIKISRDNVIGNHLHENNKTIHFETNDQKKLKEFRIKQGRDIFHNFLRTNNKQVNHQELNLDANMQNLQSQNNCEQFRNTIQNKVNKDKLWKIKTNKSIKGGGQSRASQNRLDFGDDPVSQYSLICQSSKMNQNQLRSLVSQQMSINSAQKAYCHRQLKESTKFDGFSTMYKSSQQFKKINNDQYTQIQPYKSAKPNHSKCHQKIQTFGNLSAPLNHKINNKVYL